MGPVELRYNLATKVMSNGVEVIVATDRNLRPGEPEFLRLLSSTVTRPITLAPHTLINHMSMVLSSESVEEAENELVSSLHIANTFVTRTYYTTYTYLTTAVQNGETDISSRKITVSNIKTEELIPTKSSDNVIAPTSTKDITLTDSPSLQTGVFHTTYTYLNTILDGEQPLVMTSRYTISNTVTALYDYFNELEPSEVYPTTNTYLKTVEFTKTLTDGTDSQIVSTKDVLTQVVITDAFDRETVVKPITTEVTKTYFVTYTYFSTYIDGDRTRVKSDVSVSSDVTIEKFYIKPKKTMKYTQEMTSITRTAPLNILATRSYLTTLTYFTTLLQGPASEKAETIVTTRTRLMQNVVTETLSFKHFGDDYLIKLRNSLHRQGNGTLITTATLKDGEKVEITAIQNGVHQPETLPQPSGTASGAVASANIANGAQMKEKEELKMTRSSHVKATPTIGKSKTTTVLKFVPNKPILNEIKAEALVEEESGASEVSVLPISTASSSQFSNHRINKTKTTLPTLQKTVSPALGKVEEHLPTEEKDAHSVIPSPTKKKPSKQPASDLPVNFLNLTSLGINGINVLGPVFNAMAELINNNINNKNVNKSANKINETISVKNDYSSKKPATVNVNPLLNFVSSLKATTKAEPKVKSTTPRTPVYIPVGSFALAEDIETSESKSNLLVSTNSHQKWLDTQGKNLEKNKILDNGITILEGGIPISPGQVITTNSDVIIGRPGSSGPRPPNFGLKDNLPIDMKPPPPPVQLELQADDAIGQHSTIQSVKPGQQADGIQLPFPDHNHRLKHRPHDSDTLDLNPPPVPVSKMNVHRPITINHKPHEIVPYKADYVETNIIPIPVHLAESYLNLPEKKPPSLGAAENKVTVIGKPAVNGHGNNHEGLLVTGFHSKNLPLMVSAHSNMEDRSSGQPLLVNIQPSQVANVVIPSGSSTALIINNENQHSLKGEVIDDPSPHPEPETVGFVGVEPVLRLENGDITPPLQNVHQPGPAVRPNGEANRPSRHQPATKVFHKGSGHPGQHNHPNYHHFGLSSNKQSSPQKIGSVAGVQYGEESNILKAPTRVLPEYGSRVKEPASRVPVLGHAQGLHYRDEHGHFLANTQNFQTPVDIKNPVKMGNGIYVDISPPGHLPPRPDFAVAYKTVLPAIQPGSANDFSNHQSGLVHDVPLNAQVQLGSGPNNDQAIKDALTNANKYDKVKNKHQSQSENQNFQKKPHEDITKNLHPPPPPPKTGANRRPPWAHTPQYHPSPVHTQSPTNFMVPPPQVSHRPNYKSTTDVHPGPLMIPIGAGAPEQTYPYPRPEDIVVVPHNIHSQFPVNQFGPGIHQADLDVGDANDPIRTEDGEEIQETNARPLLPGQLQTKLEKNNRTMDGRPTNVATGYHRPPDINSAVTYGINRPSAPLHTGFLNVNRPVSQIHYNYKNKSSHSGSMKINYGVHNGGAYSEAEQIFGTKLNGNNVRLHKPQNSQEIPGGSKTRVETEADSIALNTNLKPQQNSFVNETRTDILNFDKKKNKPANADGLRKATRPIVHNVRYPPKPFSSSGVIQHNKGTHESLWIAHGSHDAAQQPARKDRPVKIHGQDSLTSSSIWTTVKDEKNQASNVGKIRPNTSAAERPDGSVKPGTVNNQWNIANADFRQKVHGNRRQNATENENAQNIKFNVTNQRIKVGENQTDAIRNQQNNLKTVQTIHFDTRNKSATQIAVSRHPEWVGSNGQQDQLPHSSGNVKYSVRYDEVDLTQQTSGSKNVWTHPKPITENGQIPQDQLTYVVNPQETNNWIGTKPTRTSVNLSNKWLQQNSTKYPVMQQSEKPGWHPQKEDNHHNRTSTTKISTSAADINIFLTSPKADLEVMGLSPPPPERPRRPPRPQRPKPPFKFEVPTTQRAHITIENDFPPVRSPDFNKKPIKPQDIFPPKLPENFVHHVPDFPVRTPKPRIPPESPRPSVTSLPINIPEKEQQEQASDSNEISQVFGLPPTDINGHSKPVDVLETFFPAPAKRPKPARKPETAQPFEKKDAEQPNRTVSRPVHEEKTATIASANVAVPGTGIDSGNVITGSETVFEPEDFNKYKTPVIKETTERKKMITTLITTGSTTIFGDFYTPRPTAPSLFLHGTEYVKKPNGEKVSIAPTHTMTLTVTTVMTTVVQSIGQKPSTKTVVLTKTILSTVVDKVTETQTLVRPTTATVTQTHTIATTKTALLVPTAIRPAPTKYYPGVTLKPEIFVADPHSKDTMTISVSTSMGKDKKAEDKRKHSGGRRPDAADNDSILVVMTNKHPKANLSTDHFDRETDSVEGAGVFLGGVYNADGTKQYKTPLWQVECMPECKATRNERCQKVDGEMKCVCRPGFARMFPDRPCMPTYTYNMKLLLEKSAPEFSDDFAQSDSLNYLRLKALTKEGLDRMIMQSDYRDVFHGISVNSFQPMQNKTEVDFYVQLSENTDEAKLTDVFRKTLRLSNYSLGGTELYAARETDILRAEDFNECLSTKFHDCSENARCFNLRGTYTCSCKEGFTDLSENSLFPGRMCSDMIGCEYCGYHGTCFARDDDQVTCECFQWYSGERCRINLKVLLIALVTIGSILLALLLVCGILTCIKKRSKSSATTRANGSTGYLRYRGHPTQSLDKRAMIEADSSSESSIDNLPYINPPPPPPPSGTLSAKRKTVPRQNLKGPAPRPKEVPCVEQQDRSVTVMIPRAKYRPVPPMPPLLTMSTFSPDKHLHRTSAQISTEQKLISYLEGNSREGQAGNDQKSNPKHYDAPRSGPAFKKEQRVFEYEYKTSNMQINDGTSSGERRSSKHGDSERRFRRHSDSTHLNSENSRNFHHRKYSAGALVSAGFEVSATVGLRQKDFDTSEDEQSGILNTSTMKSNRSQFTTLNRTGDHKTMSEARSYDETTIHPPTRTLKTNYSGSSPSSRINNDEGHTMVERDIGSTFIMPESHLFKPEGDRGSDISTFDSL